MIRQRWGMRYGLGRNTPMSSATRQLSFRTSPGFVHTAQVSFLFYGHTKIKCGSQWALGHVSRDNDSLATVRFHDVRAARRSGTHNVLIVALTLELGEP